MILTIDVGNSRIKAAVFENNTLLDLQVLDKNEWITGVENILKGHPKISHLVVASVGNIQQQDFLRFEKQLSISFISHDFTFPFNNLYQTPLTLGIDRMVLSAGAVLQFPKQNRLVIDAGSCITYDFIDAADNYIGGAISPGIKMRYSALHQYTSRLPLLEAAMPVHFTGSSTKEAIHSGVVNGVVYEVQGFIAEYEKQYSKFTIILTGGDTDFLAKRLKNTIFANSNFLLESLNRTFQYKTEND